MATRLQNQNVGVDFIDENPAIAAYQKQTKFLSDQDAADEDLKSKKIKNEFDTSANPTRLRKLGAETSSTESTADVDYRTRDSKVASSAAGASLATTNAGVAAQTAPYKVDEAASGARTARAGADVAEGTVEPRVDQSVSGARTARAGADVAVATVPTKIEEEGQRLRQQRAGAQRTEMDNFHKTIEMLDQGNIEGAKEMARQAGQEIPDAVLNDNRVRDVVIQAAKRAKELYPDRPANQQAYISAQLGEIQQRIASGQQPDRYTPYQMPPGAPAPVESSGSSQYDIVHRQETDPATGQPVVKSYKFDKKSGDMEPIEGTGAFGSTRGGAGGATGQTERIIGDLRKENPSLTYAEALAIVKKSGQSPDVLSVRKEGLALSAAKADTAYLTNPVQTIEKYRRQYGLPPASATPAPAPAAPPKSGSGLPPAASVTGTRTVNMPTDLAGTGTRESPWVASTQAHVDWFKQNAKPGDVIVVNGQKYTVQ